jgi:hypothetical protein
MVWRKAIVLLPKDAVAWLLTSLARSSWYVLSRSSLTGGSLVDLRTFTNKPLLRETGIDNI